MKKTAQIFSLSIIAVVLCLMPSTAGVDAAARLVTAETFIGHIEFLADKRLEGRQPGTPGCRRAARYIASKLKDAGVQPGGDNGSYYQNLTFTLRGTECKTRNVVGILPGTDKKLKDEAIVVTAHYDHLGRGYLGPGRRRQRFVNSGKSSDDKRFGEVYPGANDNASGSAGILEIARVIDAEKLKLKRKLIFIAFTGEEAGLRGSRYYVNHPVVPLEKTMVNVNLDMIGNYDNGAFAMGVHMSPQFDEVLDEVFVGTCLNIKRRKSAGSSDNLAFNARNIPSLLFFTGMDNIFHTPNDTVENINKDDGARLLQGIVKTVCWLADAKKLESSMKHPRGVVLPYLGISSSKQKGGVVVDRAYRNSPAEKAGIEPGDVLISIGDKIIKEDKDVEKALYKFKAGDKVDVIIRRGRINILIEVKLENSEPFSRPRNRGRSRPRRRAS